MNKFKAFFGQPLISSSTKIVPLKESSPDSARKAKPPELITLKKIDTPVPILNKKPEKSKTITPNQRPVKKNRMSLRFVSGPAPISFDFEQYDDVVDAQLMKKRQIAKIENKPVSPESPASPASPNGRRHTWAVPENRDARFKAEFIRIPVNADSRHSLQVKPKVEALAPPPVVVSKVISESEITDSSDSSDNVTDSIRKDLGENGIEFLDDFKKGPAEKSGFEPSDFFASHDRLKVDNEENKEEKEENEEEDLPNLDEFKLSRSRPRHLSDSPVKIKDFMTEEERERQREIFLKVSLQQANDIRKAQNEKINENLSAVASSSSSSDSDVDSLIENNPFEDEKTYQLKKKATFRRMQTRLREDERYSKLRYILFPDDRWRKFWDIIIVIALLYTALVMPIRIAFLTDDGGDESTGSTLWPIVEYLIDSIFLGDIILTFFSAYFDRADSLVVSKKKIAWHYLTGWFFLDLVSILPFQLFMSNDQTNGDSRLNNLVRIARLPRLYRLVKIIQLARMVKIIRNRSQFLKYMNTTLKLGPAYERLLVSVIGILLFCHIASCIWYMLVGLSDPETGWLGTYMITYLPTFDQYIACFYLVVQTVTTVGYGDMPPQNPGERLLTVFLMIFGVLCYSIFIGFLSSLINDTEVMNQIYNHKLNILHRLTKEYALPVFFQKKLKTAIKFQNKQTMDSKHFIGDLPTGLAVDLACIMHRDIVESIPFLQNRPKGFIASLCPTLKPITVHKNDPVFSEGDPADEIFFIKSGTIGLVLPKYKNECFLKVREGYFFGEIDLLFYGEIRKYTAIALKDCELYVLNKKDFKHVFLSEHRDIGASLYDNAYMRKQRTRKAFKEAVEICKGFQNQKHRKIRLSIITKANPLDFEPESSESDKGLGIVEEEEEEEEEHHKEKKPDGCGVPVSETKPLNPLLNLKVALALSRGLNGQRQSVMAAIGSPAKRASVMGVLGSPKPEVENKFAGLKARRSIFGSLLPPPKEENNVQFSDLNKKLDSLEAKMAKLAALGESMRARTSRDRDSMSMRDSMRDSVGSPGLPKSERNKSLLSRVLALTPSNQPRALPTDLKVPMDLSVGGVSPTNSDTSWGGLRSPNALKRQLIKKDGGPFQSSIPPIKRLSSPQNSQFDLESDRITPTPTGDLLMNKGAFMEFRAANESLTVRGDSFKDSINLDQSSREGDGEAKEAKEDKEEEKLSQEEKPEKVEKAEKVVGRVERKSAFRDQLRIGLKKITEREEDDAKNEKAKAHNFLFIQERRGSYKNPDKLDRKATMGGTKESNQNVEVEEF